VSHEPEWWGVAEAASHCHVTPATWRGYVHRGYGPAPDLRVGRTPAWRPETVRAWHTARPGKTGRPRKTPAAQSTEETP
jgi:hypothetical protein